MWALDPANSGELIARLRPHGRDGNFEVAWVGVGWRPLVEECHERLAAAFPDYELLAIKRRYGALQYQAFPRRGTSEHKQASAQEKADLNAIISVFRAISERVCEWCGEAGRLRGWRTVELALCAACDQRFPDPPVPTPHT